MNARLIPILRAHADAVDDPHSNFRDPGFANTVALPDRWGYSRIMTNTTDDTTPADMAEQIKSQIPGACRVSRVTGDGSRFARFEVQLPNGQQFSIQIEEC